MTQRINNVLAEYIRCLKDGTLKTFAPLLSIFKMNGEPMGLKRHYQMIPMYNTVQPEHMVCMCGRQVGKSVAICTGSILRSGFVPNYNTLILQPRADQIRRLNATIYQPLLRSCVIQDSLITNLELSKMALKTFNNGSLVYMDHMMVSADRIRGISDASLMIADECQDIEYEYLLVANEVMSASLNWGFSVYTGTPKTTDTTLALLWDKSSKAEWVIRCEHCGHFNVPNPEQDLMKMLGDDGPICAHCSKSIDVSNGGYVHAFPARAKTFPGYHVSQTVHPIHTTIPSKWSKLMNKVHSYQPLTLYNEVFGWPYDSATSPLSLADLQKASHDLKPTTLNEVLAVLPKYRYITVGVDWSGGSVVSDSYTSYAILGLNATSDIIDVIYGHRIPKGVDPSDEADEVLYWISRIKANAFAYDNGGAGFARLEIMKHRGLMSVPNLTIVPINYVAPRSGDVMKLHPGSREPDLYYYTLDKSRSLAINITAIKSCRLRFPKFDAEDEQAYQRDFLALREDPRKSIRNETVVLITKKSGTPDDFAHAVNFGCSQIWDHFGAYPRIGTKYDAGILDDDGAFDNNHLGPRGDFDRFSGDNSRGTVVQYEYGDDVPTRDWSDPI